MSADSLSRILKTAEGSLVAAGSSDVVITKLAQALVRDPKDGVKALRRWGRKAKKDPHKAMGALATFGEVLKRAVALLRCIPQKFGKIIEAFQEAAAAVAPALKASSLYHRLRPAPDDLALLLLDVLRAPGRAVRAAPSRNGG